MNVDIMKEEMEVSELKCPHCEANIDMDKQLEIGLYNNCEDGFYEGNCDSCKKDFIVGAEWNPTFTAITVKEYEEL